MSFRIASRTVKRLTPNCALSSQFRRQQCSDLIFARADFPDDFARQHEVARLFGLKWQFFEIKFAGHAPPFAKSV